MSLVFKDREVFKSNSVNSLLESLNLTETNKTGNYYNHYELREYIIDILNSLPEKDQLRFKLELL